MEYALLIYIYAGTWAKGDSVALQTVPGFATIEECNRAGDASKSLVAGSAKELRYRCYAVKARS